MITQALYLDLQVMASGYLANHPDVPVDDQLKEFIRPYMLVIHRPSRQGFYIDQRDRHILDVSNCQEPKNPIKKCREHFCKCASLPAWADQIDGLGLRSEEFDTFWLY